MTEQINLLLYNHSKMMSEDNNVVSNNNNSNQSVQKNVKKEKNWTMLEDFYLLEGYMQYPRKWNKIKEYMQTSGHLDSDRKEEAIATRFKNLCKTENPYAGMYQRKTPKPLNLDPQLHQKLIMKLHQDYGEKEEQSEKLFYAVKRLLSEVREKTQKTTSTADTSQTEQEVHQTLMIDGELRKEERKLGKNRLVDLVEADTEMRKKIMLAVEDSSSKVATTAQLIAEAVSCLKTLIELKTAKLQMEMQRNQAPFVFLPPTQDQ